jgi:hypothetical protein
MGPQANDPLHVAVQAACAGRPAVLHDFLQRRGALPGPRPNLRLARNAAAALIAAGPAGLRVLSAMRALPANLAPRDSSSEFLPLVGVLGAGVLAARSSPASIADVLADLQSATEDPRPHVRDSVVHALREVLAAHGDEAVASLSGWTDGYLQGAAALEALAEPQVLQSLKAAPLLVARMQECFALVAGAPRSHERSQGYRALLRTLAVAMAVVGRKFPIEVGQWLQQAAATQVPELRSAIESALVVMRGAGVRAADVQQAQRALDSSKRAPRDPRDDVGPTRSRGRKAKRRGTG